MSSILYSLWLAIKDPNHLQFEQVFFDGCVALFTFLLWRTSHRQWQVAQIALRGGRPYLLPEYCVVGGYRDGANRFDVPLTIDNFGTALLGAIVRLRNFGQSPALLDEVTVRMKPIARFSPKLFKESIPEKSPVEVLKPDSYVDFNTGIGDSVLTPEQMRLISQRWEAPLYLVVYGHIRYHGLLGQRYRSWFVWNFTPPYQLATGEALPGQTYRGLAKYNHAT